MSGVGSEIYPLFTDEELQNYREADLSTDQLDILYEKKKVRIDNALNVNILERNRSPRQPIDIQSTVNIVLFGKTGHGKSATANMLCGKDIFMSSDGAGSCTEMTKSCDTTYNGTHFRIVDTPGFFDTKSNPIFKHLPRQVSTAMPPPKIKREAAKCVDLCDEGVHVFLYVYSATTVRFTHEELAAIQVTKKLFGSEVFNFAGIVLTNTDKAFDAGKTLNDYIETTVQSTELEIFIKDDINCRIVGVNNAAKKQYEREFFRKGLFDLIYTILDKNQQRVYLHDDMKKAKQINLELEGKRQAEIVEQQNKLLDSFHQAFERIQQTIQEKAEDYFRNLSLEQLEMKKSDGHLATNERIKKEVMDENPSECKQIKGNILNGMVQKCVDISADSAKYTIKLNAEELEKTEENLAEKRREYKEEEQKRQEESEKVEEKLEERRKWKEELQEQKEESKKTEEKLEEQYHEEHKPKEESKQADERLEEQSRKYKEMEQKYKEELQRFEEKLEEQNRKCKEKEQEYKEESEKMEKERRIYKEREQKRREESKKVEETRKTELDEMKASEEQAIKKSAEELSDVVWKQISDFVRNSKVKPSEEPTDEVYEEVTQNVWDALSERTRNRNNQKDVKLEVINQAKIKKDAIIKLTNEIHMFSMW